MKSQHILIATAVTAALVVGAFYLGLRFGAAGYFPPATFPHRSRVQISGPAGSPDMRWRSTAPDGRSYQAPIFLEQLRRTPPVGFGPREPRLTAFQAAALARQAFVAEFPAYQHWDLDNVSLEFITTDGVRYGIYEVEFAFFDYSDGTGGWWTPQFHFRIPVMLDGTVIMPRAEAPAEP